MTLFRPTIVTDVFTFLKQRAIQLPFTLGNLRKDMDMPEARLNSHVNRCHISAGTHKFKSAVLLSGVPFQKPTLKKLEHILSCKSSRSCPKLLACVPIGVPCPKWMSCKCAVIVLYISNKMKKIIALPHSWESKCRYNHILLLQATKMSDYPHQGRQYLKMSTG